MTLIPTTASRDFRRRVRRLLSSLLVAVLVGAIALVISMAMAKVPEVPARTRVAAPAVTVPGMTVCWVEYDAGSTLGVMASRGWPTSFSWHTTTSGLLVRHPAGDLLIDVGKSAATAEESASLPWFPRTFIAASGREVTFTARLPEALKQIGYADPRALRWAVPTHGHFDHLGGIMNLPGVPVLLSAEEMTYVRSARGQQRLVFDEHAKALEGRAEELVFRSTPYEVFPESADLLGDGSVVAVRLPGHTPGHIGVIVNVSPKLRLFYVGDAVSARAGYIQRVPKNFLLAYTDDDRRTTDETVAVLAQLHESAPDLTMIPAHDREAWVGVFGHSPTCVSAPP